MMNKSSNCIFTNISKLVFMASLFFANYAKAQDPIRLINTPQCAADMSKPADSILITASLRNTGIVLNNIAKTTNSNQQEFIQKGLKFYKDKLVFLTETILEGLRSGRLPLVQEKNQATLNLKYYQKAVSTANLFEKTECLQVNEINNKYSHLFIRGVNKDTLTELAKQYTLQTTQADCAPENIKSDLDLYPVFHFDLKKISQAKTWNKVGFQFWDSFKIYLSIAWKVYPIQNLNNSHLNNLTLMVPMEEEVLILSNGCKSIEKPECNTSFLSTAELRNLFTTDRAKLEMTSSSNEMKDLIVDNSDNVDSKIRLQLAEKSGNNRWISDFQKSYSGFASRNIENLYFANKLFTSAVTQKTIAGLSTDLEEEFSNYNKNKEEIFYLCSEHRLLTQEQPLNIMKSDLENLSKNGGIFDQYLRAGMTSLEIIQTHKTLSTKMTELCNKYDKYTAETDDSNWTQYMPWYEDFLSRYQFISAQINSNQSETNTTNDLFKQNLYLTDLCSSAIDCHRKMTQSIVQLNKLVIHARTFFKSQIQSAPVFNERAEKVACNIYDPFEASRLNTKKLLADIGSAALLSWTNLPIFLDVQFKPKEMISFKTLVDTGKITFDTSFKAQTEKSLGLSLGSFVNVPCSINISTAGYDIENKSSNILFDGISVKACQGAKTNYVNSNGSVDDISKSVGKNIKGCFECALNFKKISTLNFLNVFAPVRSLVKIVEGVMRYRNVLKNDIINPREYSINKDYLIDTYKEYGEIPDKCVPLLAKGLSCSPSVCESLVKKDFEIKTGLEVSEVKLKSSKNKFTKYKKAIISSPNCQNEIELDIKCVGDGKRFHMSVPSLNYLNCTKD